MHNRKRMPPHANVARALELVRNDASFPPRRRASILSSLRRLPVWATAKSRCIPKLDANTMPFNERVISDLFEGLAPCVAGVSEKRLKNAHSDVRYVLERYRLGRRRLRVSFSGPVSALNAKLARVEQWRIAKLFAFLSMEGIDPEKFD